MSATAIWGQPIQSLRSGIQSISRKISQPGKGVISTVEQFRRGKAAGKPGAASPTLKPSAAEPIASGWPYNSGPRYTLEDATKNARNSASRGWQERYLQERSKTYRDYANAVERAAAERKLKEGLSWQPWKDPRRPLSRPLPPPPGRSQIIKKPVQVAGGKIASKIVSKVAGKIAPFVPIIGQVVSAFEIANTVSDLAKIIDKTLEDLIGLTPPEIGEGLTPKTPTNQEDFTEPELPPLQEPGEPVSEPPPAPTPYDPSIPSPTVLGNEWYLVQLDVDTFRWQQCFITVTEVDSNGRWIHETTQRLSRATSAQQFYDYFLWVKAPLNLDRVRATLVTRWTGRQTNGWDVTDVEERFYIHGSGYADLGANGSRINSRLQPYGRIGVGATLTVFRTEKYYDMGNIPQEIVQQFPGKAVGQQEIIDKTVLTKIGTTNLRVTPITPIQPIGDPIKNPEPIIDRPRREEEMTDCPNIKPLLRQHQAQINNIISQNQVVINNQLAAQTTNINNQLVAQTANVNNIVNTGNATINANVTTAQNTIMGKLGDMQAGLTANFDEMFRRVGSQVEGGLSRVATATKSTLDTLTENFDKFNESFKKTLKWLQIDRVLNVLILITTVHNAYMLSSNLGQTLIGALNNILTAAGNAFGLRDVDDQPIDVGPIIGGTFEAMLKAILGAENLEGIKAEWKKNNRIIQTGRNILFAVQSINNSVLGAVEMVGSNVAKIGNAIKRWGVVSENAFRWMNPTPNFQNKFYTTVESLEDAGGTIEMVSAEVLGSQEEIAQFETVIEEFEKAMAQESGAKQGKESPEALRIKAQEDAAKAASTSNI